MKYDYTKKILNEHLGREIETWKYWKAILKDGKYPNARSSEQGAKQVNSNIAICEGRIEELKAVIKMLK